MSFQINDYFGELINEIGSVTDECAGLIGQEQLAQIKALEVEVESLKNQLREKDEHLSFLAKSQKNRHLIKDMESTINSIIQQKLQELEQNPNSNGQTNLQKIRRLHEIESLSDIRQKLKKIIDLFSEEDKQDSFNIETEIESVRGRLLSALQGHVEFLTRLAESPELQSLFLISTSSGQTFLSETTRQLLSEQAARTSEFIYKEMKKGQNHNQYFSDCFNVSNILDLEKQVDIRPEERLEMIKKLLSSDHNWNADELKQLLIQEVLISSVLRNYCESRIKINDEYKQGLNRLASIFNKRLNSSENIQKICKEIEAEFNAMKNEIEKKDSILKNTSISIKSNKKLFENQESTIQSLQNAITSSQTKSAELESQISQLKNEMNVIQEENDKLKIHHKRSKTLIEKLKQAKLLTQQKTDSKDQEIQRLQKEIQIQKKTVKEVSARAQIATKSSNWEEWGRRLYYALTGVMDDTLHEEDLRIAIEESALTAVGNPKVQSFLSQFIKEKQKPKKW